MNLQQRIKKELQQYFKTKIIVKPNDHNEQFDSQNIEQLAFLFFISSKDDLNLAREVIRLGRKEFKNTIAIFFSDVNYSVDVITDRNFHIFNANDFDYKWDAGPELKKWIGDNKTDLLINFCFTDTPEVTNLYSILNSKFKIACQLPSYKVNSDLIINIKENNIDYNAFYNLAVENLRMLNIKRI